MKSFISTISPPTKNLGHTMCLTGFSENDHIAAARYYLSYHYRKKKCYLRHLYFWAEGQEDNYKIVNIGDTFYNYELS